MKRREFINKSVQTGAALGLSGLTLQACSGPAQSRLRVMHTNDVHSHIESFGPENSRYPLMGGVARRAALIEKLKAEEPNCLLLDAGDIFQGTPYFNYFGGELEFKMMSRLGYDASTLGNHDFDNGIDGLVKQLPHAEFEFIISNYDFKNTAMDGRSKKYKIYNKNGIKVGVFGLGIQLDGLVDPAHFKETMYLDPVGISQDMIRQLREVEGCDLVIALSHLGYFYKSRPDRISDLVLSSKTAGIDLIIGGHTHTFLKRPTVTKNLKDQNMLVNQVGCWGVQLGVIDFVFEDAKLADAKGVSYQV